MAEGIAPSEHIPCDLCGGEDTRVLYKGSERADRPWAIEDIVASSDRYGVFGSIVKCRACGLVYADPRVPAGVLEKGYLDSEDKDYLNETESRSINAFMSLAVIRRHAEGGSLLEVGCSTGFFLNAARVWFQVRGLELSKWAADFVRDKLGIQVESKTLEEAEYPDGHFDVVAMADVIEHLPSPRKTLAEAHRILKPGGVVYLVTPDIGSLSSAVLGRFWWALRPGHVYYFSKATMHRLLREQGFEIVHSAAYGRIFSWNYWLSRLSTYPDVVRAPVSFFIRLFGLERKFLYLNTRDAMEVVARKRV